MNMRIPQVKKDRWTAAVATTIHLEHGEGGGLPRLAMLRGGRSLPSLFQRLWHPGRTARVVRRLAGEGMPCLAH
jgi:hypothetical protein